MTNPLALVFIRLLECSFAFCAKVVEGLLGYFFWIAYATCVYVEGGVCSPTVGTGRSNFLHSLPVSVKCLFARGGGAPALGAECGVCAVVYECWFDIAVYWNVSPWGSAVSGQGSAFVEQRRFSVNVVLSSPAENTSTGEQ